MGYEFDSTAIYSYYFILSILVLYITIATYFALKPLFGLLRCRPARFAFPSPWLPKS
jgi:hypothetical protein